MKCKSCGFDNINHSKYCVKCGNSLEEITELINQQSVEEKEVIQKADVDYVEYLKSLPKEFLNLLKKPFETFYLKSLKHRRRYNHIFAVVVVMLIAIVNLVINIIIKNSSSLIENFFNTIIIYAAFIYGIALVYYVAALIVKRKISYSKTVKMASVSLLPYLIGVIILPGLLVKINTFIAVLVALSSLIYSFTIFYELINNEIGLVKDKKIFFNTLCILSIIIILYIVLVVVIKTSIANAFIF